ncbi:hypothetical protein GCM10028857_24570 [Salinarchaeum chitinilyticum]
MEGSRRRFLKASGAVVGTGLLGASAGCTGILGGGGGGGGSGLTAHTDWYFEPGAIADTDHHTISYQGTMEIANNEDQFDSDYYDDTEQSFEDSYEYLGLDFDEVESRTYFGGFLATLLSGYTVDRSEIVESLEDNDYEDDDEYEGVQVFLGPNESRAVGVTNNEIVVTSGSWNTDDEAIDVLETAVDTYNGEEDRYVDENENFAALTSRLNGGTFGFAATHEETEETDAPNGRFEGAVAQGSASDVKGETMDIQAIYLFDSADDIDMGDVEDYRDESDSFDDIDDVSLNRSGRSVIISGTMDTDDYGTN